MCGDASVFVRIRESINRLRILHEDYVVLIPGESDGVERPICVVSANAGGRSAVSGSSEEKDSN
jgi:hypothetical protein